MLRPPQVSLREGMLVVDSEAVGDALRRLAPDVGLIGCSAQTQPSHGEEGLLDAMEAVLAKNEAAVVAVRPVSEAVKVVEGGWVVAGLDRSSLVTLAYPVLFTRRALSTLLAGVTDRRWVNPVQDLVDAGGRVRGFPAPN